MITEKRMSTTAYKQKVGSAIPDRYGGFINKKTGSYSRSSPAPYGKFTKPKSKKEAQKDLKTAQRDRSKFFKTDKR